MAHWTATHESGKTWKLATPPKLKGEVMNQRAKNFARNWCHKQRLTGVVKLECETGEVTTFTINPDYSI